MIAERLFLCCFCFGCWVYVFFPVGGEPLLHPLFFEIIRAAKNKGFVTSLLSNEYYLNEAKLVELSSYLDWFGLSVRCDIINFS